MCVCVCVCVRRLSGQAPDRDSLAWLHSNVQDVMSLLQHIPSAPSALPEVSEQIYMAVNRKWLIHIMDLCKYMFDYISVCVCVCV